MQTSKANTNQMPILNINNNDPNHDDDWDENKIGNYLFLVNFE